jgi:hypothetical protein
MPRYRETACAARLLMRFTCMVPQMNWCPDRLLHLHKQEAEVINYHCSFESL